MKKNIQSVALIIFIAFFSSCKKETTTVNKPPVIPPVVVVPGTSVDNDNLLMGNPSNAAGVADSTNNYLLRKTYYALSYSRDRGTPNWVSWHLFRDDLGIIDRQNNFLPDATIPGGWYQVDDRAYVGSGFDRGHNCPSADRSDSADANTSTFLMTNIIPQAPNQNQHTWANMEGYIRTLIYAGNEAYIIMGSYGTGGTGSNGYANAIDNDHVTVPSNIWKVVVVIPNGDDDTTRMNTTTRVITVNIPNSNTLAPLDDWKRYRTSVDAIEAATGYNLLSRLPIPVQNVVEAAVDDK